MAVKITTKEEAVFTDEDDNVWMIKKDDDGDWRLYNGEGDGYEWFPITPEFIEAAAKYLRQLTKPTTTKRSKK